MKMSFTQNWNNKIDSQFWITTRPFFEKYFVTGRYEIYIKEAYCYDALCVDLKFYKTEQLTPFISLLDTGLDLGPFREMITKMYPENKLWKVMLMKRIK